jgi:hypothetical protein
VACVRLFSNKRKNCFLQVGAVEAVAETSSWTDFWEAGSTSELFLRRFSMLLRFWWFPAKNQLFNNTFWSTRSGKSSDHTVEIIWVQVAILARYGWCSTLLYLQHILLAWPQSLPLLLDNGPIVPLLLYLAAPGLFMFKSCISWVSMRKVKLPVLLSALSDLATQIVQPCSTPLLPGYCNLPHHNTMAHSWCLGWSG